MDLYYINLEKRTDRRAQMEQRFAQLGLHANRISAVQPADLTQQQKQQCQRSLSTSDPIVEAEFCCNLSHKRAIETFIASDAPHAALFEDDIAIAGDLPDLLAHIDRDGLPCGLLRIETYLDRCHFGIRPVARFARYTCHAMHGYTWGSAGYIMSRAAAMTYLNTPKMLGITADRALWRRFPNATGVKSLQLVPAPVVQVDRYGSRRGVGSDIESGRYAANAQAIKEHPLSTIRRFCRDEITIAVPSLISRGLGQSTRAFVPFSGEWFEAKPEGLDG